MKKIIALCMVALLVACGGQTPKSEGEKKDSIVSARDVAEEKKAEAMHLVDSLKPVLEAAQREEAELTAWVMEHAVELKDDAPEVLRLNRMRMHLDSLQKQFAVAQGQIRYLERVMEGKK